MSEAARQYLHPKLAQHLDRQAQQNLVLLFNLDAAKAKQLVSLVLKKQRLNLIDWLFHSFKWFEI